MFAKVRHFSMKVPSNGALSVENIRTVDEGLLIFWNFATFWRKGISRLKNICTVSLSIFQTLVILKKVVRQISRARCKGETLIFETVADLITKKNFFNFVHKEFWICKIHEREKNLYLSPLKWCKNDGQISFRKKIQYYESIGLWFFLHRSCIFKTTNFCFYVIYLRLERVV